MCLSQNLTEPVASVCNKGLDTVGGVDSLDFSLLKGYFVMKTTCVRLLTKWALNISVAIKPDCYHTWNDLDYKIVFLGSTEDVVCKWSIVLEFHLHPKRHVFRERQILVLCFNKKHFEIEVQRMFQCNFDVSRGSRALSTSCALYISPVYTLSLLSI